MTSICWICGAAADSREHKLKRRDFVRIFGDAPFSGDDAILHFVGEAGPRLIQGPNSGRMKYGTVLCGDCNSSRSQPWDRAYDRFVDWIFENEQRVLSQRFINLCDVFGDEISTSSPALYKYFVKAFGCRLANAGLSVPQHLVELLSYDSYETKLRLAFAVHKTLFALRPEHRRQLGVGELIRVDSRSEGEMERYYFRLHHGWLITNFFHDLEVPAGFGAACHALTKLSRTTSNRRC